MVSRKVYHHSIIFPTIKTDNFDKVNVYVCSAIHSSEGQNDIRLSSVTLHGRSLVLFLRQGLTMQPWLPWNLL